MTDINSYILILIAFFIPLSIAIPSLLTLLMLIIWILLWNFKEDFQNLKKNKVVIAILLFYSVSVVGLLWSDSLEYGLKYSLQKESRLLLIPFFMLFIQKKHIKYYISAFLLATTISELFSYAIFFELIPPFHKATLPDPTPFMGHITYNPLLTIAIYLILNIVLFSKHLTLFQKTLYTLFAITMSINMFVTGGRAGQVMYFAMLMIIIIQYFNKQWLKAIMLSATLLPLLFYGFYANSKIFQSRINLAISEIEHIDTNANTSVGSRIHFAINSWNIIRENPLFGVGTGEFRSAYEETNSKNSPTLSTTINPHNMYTFILVELGIFGLFFLLNIFFWQMKHALKSHDLFIKNFGLALPLLYLIIFLSESYLLIPSTTFLFSFFSAILYKEYKEKC